MLLQLWLLRRKYAKPCIGISSDTSASMAPKTGASAQTLLLLLPRLQQLLWELLSFPAVQKKKKKQQKTFIQPCYFYRVLHKVWMPTKIKQIAFLCIFIIKLHNGIMTVWSFFLNRRPSAATWSMTKNSKQIFSEVLKMSICLLWSWTTPFLQSATVLLKTVRLWNCRSNISYVWSYSHS